jgi:hypothetical protein
MVLDIVVLLMFSYMLKNVATVGLLTVAAFAALLQGLVLCCWFCVPCKCAANVLMFCTNVE